MDLNRVIHLATMFSTNEQQMWKKGHTSNHETINGKKNNLSLSHLLAKKYYLTSKNMILRKI